MLDECDKDDENDLAPLEPVVKRAGSMSTSFAYSTFVSHLDRGLPEWCTMEYEIEPSVTR